MQISHRIFDLLNSAGKSQKNLADYLKISQQAVSNWKERGTDPPAKLISPIAEYFTVSVDYLLTGKEKNAETISNSVVANGHNSTAINGLSKEEADVLKIYREFDFDKRLEFLNVLAELKK